MAVALALVVSTMVSAIFPSASMVWLESQSLSAGVAVNAAVNVHNRGLFDYSEYRVSAGHSHGPPTVINVQFCDEQTYYVLAGDTPVLVHNAGSECGVPLPTQVKGPTQRLTNAQATDLANYLGYRYTGQTLRGEKVFTNGRTYIVQDTTSHNGGTWKIANSIDALNSKTTRTATTDALLNMIGG